MDFGISLGLGGWVILAAGALVFGVAAQLIGDVETGYEWVPDTIAAFIGGLAASEFITAWRTFEPVWDGLALVPALVGGLVVGVIVEIVTRMMTGGHYFGHPMSA